MFVRHKLSRFFLLLVLFLGGCCSLGFTQSEYVIKEGDKLSIQVLEQSELDGTYQVSPEGFLSFPLIQEPLQACGVTYDGLASKIKEALEKDYFYKATVIVSAFNGIDVTKQASVTGGGVVYVYGQARSTGVIDIPENEVLTVSKVIIRCGGFQDFADKKKVKLIRKSPSDGKSQITIINMDRVITKGKSEEDIVVKDGDVIVVPEKFFNF